MPEQPASNVVAAIQIAAITERQCRAGAGAPTDPTGGMIPGPSWTSPHSNHKRWWQSTLSIGHIVGKLINRRKNMLDFSLVRDWP
jgi:hypothetical protein